METVLYYLWMLFCFAVGWRVGSIMGKYKDSLVLAFVVSFLCGLAGVYYISKVYMATTLIGVVGYSLTIGALIVLLVVMIYEEGTKECE